MPRVTPALWSKAWASSPAAAGPDIQPAASHAPSRTSQTRFVFMVFSLQMSMVRRDYFAGTRLCCSPLASGKSLATRASRAAGSLAIA